MDNSLQTSPCDERAEYGATYTPTIDLTLPCYQQTVPQNGEQNPQQGVGLTQQLNNHGGSSKMPSTKARDKNYVNAEGEVLCSAYLNISKDPIVGTSQAAGTYWGRVTKYFNDHRRTPIERSSESVQKRLRDIQKETFKFSCYYGEIQRKNESGKSEDDKIKDALELYQGNAKKPFKYMHCWLILRHEQKFNEYAAGLSTTKPTQSPPPPSPSVDGQPSEPPAEARPFVRPMGRDRAKRQRTTTSSSNSTACFEVLHKLQSDRAEFEEYIRCASKTESEEMSSRSDRKLELQEKQLQLATRSTLVQEQMLALQEKERDDRLMGMDIDKVAPWARQYYIDQQAIVIAKAKQAAAKAKADAEHEARHEDTEP